MENSEFSVSEQLNLVSSVPPAIKLRKIGVILQQTILGELLSLSCFVTTRTVIFSNQKQQSKDCHESCPCISIYSPPDVIFSLH